MLHFSYFDILLAFAFHLVSLTFGYSVGKNLEPFIETLGIAELFFIPMLRLIVEYVFITRAGSTKCNKHCHITLVFALVDGIFSWKVRKTLGGFDEA